MHNCVLGKAVCCLDQIMELALNLLQLKTSPRPGKSIDLRLTECKRIQDKTLSQHLCGSLVVRG